MEYSGLAEVEFKYDQRSGRYKLLDVNPRVWTWHTLCAAAGVDFPYLQWQSMNGEPPRDLRGRPGVRWVRMSTDVVAALSELAKGRLSVRKYFESLRAPIQLSTFALDDPLPSLLGVPMASASRIKRLLPGANDSRTKRCTLACSS
jgi:predicted ATP-grasp superfamily ATP-dependent carboligase